VLTESLQEFAKDKELHEQVRKLQRNLSTLRAKKLNLELAIEQAAHVAFKEMAPPKPAKPTLKRGKGDEVALITTTDWQGHKVTPDYDGDVLKKRIARYAAQVIELTGIQRADHPVTTARVWMLGDMVEGEKIFPGQEYEIDAGIVDQLFGAPFEAGRDFINTMLETFERVEVVGVIGNHGRVGSRSNPYHPNTNMDRALYKLLRAWFTAAGVSKSRLKFTIPDASQGDRGWYYVDTVGNYRAMLIHGDQFRGGNSFAGLPFYSFATKALKWKEIAVYGEMPMFDDIWAGHWHRVAKIPIGVTKVRICGTTESYSPYAHETLATTSRPAQVLAFCQPRKGMITSEYEVYLDDEKERS
jgi:hypothetical protein